ncbi:hypothetical protein SNE40_003074 [Patella caerulea]|uniref:Uncharacterized protein n=2 Tax=Patella caerulea TaxID=87958 RepID=A0AAN8K284_PATCE
MGKSHKELEKIKSSSRSILSAFSTQNNISDKVTRAEVKIAHLVAQHNLPIASTDHLSPIFADIFPDSQIAKNYASALTKTTCILNGAIAPHFRSMLVDQMKTRPYSLAVDGSNDTGLEKMNPLTVRIYDVNTSMVKFDLLDMCCTSGRGSATAEGIFSKIKEKIDLHDIPWENCVAFGVDNTSVNLGKRNSIKTRVKQETESCYFVGCPCHLVHNLACRASDAFQSEVGFDVEDFCVDIYYWFDKSTKRKSILAEFCNFCDTEYKQVIKHVNTRWLSLERAVDRNLDLFEATKSYFKSTKESQARFKRLRNIFQDQMTEVYLLFYQSVLPVFTTFNKFLQREDPCIHAVYPQMTSFLKKLLGKFVRIDVIKTNLSVLTDVDFRPIDNQLEDENVFIGCQTRETLSKLEDEGDISPHQRKAFFKGVRAFYTKAASEAVQKFPWQDEHDLLKHARFINVVAREAASFEDVLFFQRRYSHLLPYTTPQESAALQEEFTDYQLLGDTDIPASVWDKATVKEGRQEEYIRMDVIWGFLGHMVHAGGRLRFAKLSAVAKLVLVIPHSNAGEERVFSMVRKNKTDFRNSLSVDGTLMSLLTVKLANPESTPCHRWEPPKDLMKAAKGATMNYNRYHSKN